MSGTAARQQRLSGWAPIASAVVFATASALVLLLLWHGSPAARDGSWMLSRAALRAGHLGVLWAAHACFLSAHHLAMDALPFWLAASLAGYWLGWRAALLIVLLAPLPLSLFILIACPDVSHYAGVSGISYLLLAAAGARRWRTEQRSRLLTGVAGLLLLLLQLRWRQAGPAAVAELLGSPARVVWEAHLAGLLLGLASEALLTRMAAGGTCRLEGSALGIIAGWRQTPDTASVDQG